MKSLFFNVIMAIVFTGFLISCEKESLNNGFSEAAPAALAISSDGQSDWTERKGGCAGIPGGTIVNSYGEPVLPGYDEWGYNYQAKMFNGFYCDAYRDAAWCQEYAEVELLMKWNDAWLSNLDCDGDNLLDRHHGFPSYIGSGAWLTNHQRGTYLDDDGNTCEWDYFVKIVAAPADATLDAGVWYNADGVEIGPEIWGEFAIIQEVENDPCNGVEGLQYISPDHAGLGGWQ
jgi:hypothetical protein